MGSNDRAIWSNRSKIQYRSNKSDICLRCGKTKKEAKIDGRACFAWGRVYHKHKFTKQ